MTTVEPYQKEMNQALDETQITFVRHFSKKPKVQCWADDEGVLEDEFFEFDSKLPVVPESPKTPQDGPDVREVDQKQTDVAPGEWRFLSDFDATLENGVAIKNLHESREQALENIRRLMCGTACEIKHVYAQSHGVHKRCKAKASSDRIRGPLFVYLASSSQQAELIRRLSDRHFQSEKGVFPWTEVKDGAMSGYVSASQVCEENRSKRCVV